MLLTSHDLSGAAGIRQHTAHVCHAPPDSAHVLQSQWAWLGTAHRLQHVGVVLLTVQVCRKNIPNAPDCSEWGGLTRNH